ncbi:Pogo transposable element with KRAB domain [Stylophora pistillata]|uniref:Pogo transposable element with KRAB domain n=1 Tax=Stylophora pistillata TaxID=50429 RepID=A0A2B4R6F1_STYPI|nr:Pogo transposable element with KRAB domain [Stylophora pistillata]
MNKTDGGFGRYNNIGCDIGSKRVGYICEGSTKCVVEKEDCNSSRKAAAKFDVDRNRTRAWRQNKSKLEAASSTRKWLEGAGRKSFDEDIEESLLQWVHERRSNGPRVSRKMIANKAESLYKEKCKEKVMLPSFVVSSERVKSTDEEFKTKCVVASSINGRMNEELTFSWVKSVLGQFSFTRQMLVWNSSRCHILESVKQELNRTKRDPVIVPGGCTEYVQAPDVSWNKPFKAKVTEKYDEWMANGQHAFTAAGNTRAPPRREIVHWILEAWNDVDKEIIVNDFKSCALSLVVDGSEDELVHCLKPSQHFHSSLAQLKAVQQQLQQTMENDPFQDMTLSDVEDAAPMTTLLEDSDTDIEVD